MYPVDVGAFYAGSGGLRMSFASADPSLSHPAQGGPPGFPRFAYGGPPLLASWWSTLAAMLWWVVRPSAFSASVGLLCMTPLSDFSVGRAVQRRLGILFPPLPLPLFRVWDYVSWGDPCGPANYTQTNIFCLTFILRIFRVVTRFSGSKELN